MTGSEEVFSPAEAAEFIRLLKKIQKHNYWVPSLEAWQEVQRTFSRWAVELVITQRVDPAQPKVLLCRYNGESMPEHQGKFHLAGGYERFPETIQETCSRIAKDEIGVDVIYRGILGIHKWTTAESPYASRPQTVHTWTVLNLLIFSSGFVRATTDIVSLLA